MDFKVRVKTLARLAQSETDAALAALGSEMEWAARTLEVEADYDVLSQAVDVLDAIGWRFAERTVAMLDAFVAQIEGRTLRYSDQDELLVRELAGYKTAPTLIVRAIEVLKHLRYVATLAVLRLLLRLSTHEQEQVRKKAFEGLDALTEYDLEIFYGTESRPGIGPAPQAVVIGALEALGDEGLRGNFDAVLCALGNLLSPTMEGTRWSASAVAISHAATPASVAEVRRRSVALLERMYGAAESMSARLSVIGALNEAARADARLAANEDAAAMISQDAVRVLEFFVHLVGTEDLQIVQKVESLSYWIYHHARHDEVKRAAGRVEEALRAHEEYAIYRVLIGFEGVFGDWSELKRAGTDWDTKDAERRERATAYAASITAANYAEWRARIVRYAQTQSDDLATFPTFYFFLESFARQRPELALRLVTEDAAEIERFQIPLLRGLWSAPLRDAVRAVMLRWIGEGRFLYGMSKVFLDNAQLDLEVLRRLLAQAAQRRELGALRQLVAVAVSNYTAERAFLLDEVFVPALRASVEFGDPGWIFDTWFRKELRGVVSALDREGASLVLRSLSPLPKLDYHSEEVLSLVAQRDPDAVLRFLVERLVYDRDLRREDQRQARREERSEFEAIPFEFHKLHEPLAKIPAAAVRSVRDLFTADTSLFQYRGARLLKNIFPKFSPDFEAELLALVRTGDEANVKFVASVLRSYHGELFIHPVARAIVQAVPDGSPILTEVAIALETTGVVSGEFGMAQAYERKREEVRGWLEDADPKVQTFARSYVEDLSRMAEAERKRAAEDIELRKFQYGEHPDDGVG